MSKTIHRVCPACGRNNRFSPHNVYSKNEWMIKSCANCEFVYLENSPIYEAFIKDFAWERTSKVEKNERRNREPFKQFVSGGIKGIRRRFLKRDKLPKLINKYFNAGNVLDIGCAEGGILKKLDNRYIPYGVEISEYLAEQGNKSIESKGGYVVHDSAISGLSKFEDDFFEGIIMSAFLEHEIEPLALLTECFRALKLNGKAI